MISAGLKEKLLLLALRLHSIYGDLNRVKQYLRVSLGLETAQYTHPLQKPAHYFPGLTSRPWHDPNQFDWTVKLENAYESIKAEFLQIPESCFQPQGEGLDDTGKWKVYYFYYLGRKSEENCKRCPQITQMIDSISGITNMGLVYFSVLNAGTHIMPHCGPNNTRLRCHLGVVVPEGCQIRVGDETRTWDEGKCIVFDDSFEHEVWNTSQKERVTLVIDFWHPDLTLTEIQALKRIMEISPEARKLAKRILAASAVD